MCILPLSRVIGTAMLRHAIVAGQSKMHLLHLLWLILLLLLVVSAACALWLAFSIARIQRETELLLEGEPELESDAQADQRRDVEGVRACL